ncbi:MAG: hypothetical protein K9J06_04715 [Flavobacteriales bacterium]|nr:hypothetical protein [Flavobacteriales bacterium]
MRDRLFPSALFALFIVLATGCERKEGCMDPLAINYDAEVETDNGSCVYEVPGTYLNLRFNHRLGGVDFGYGAVATNWEGRKVKFTLAQFYMSKIKLGTTTFEDSYLLVSARKDLLGVGHIGAGDHAGLSFNVGVDSAVNHLDPATWPFDHTLSSNNIDHAHWSWNPGYIFMKLEGRVDTTAAMDGDADAAFSIHIGLDELLTNVALAGNMNVSGDTAIIGINVDWLRFLDNVDLRLERSTDSFNNPGLAVAVKGNIASAFSLE